MNVSVFDHKDYKIFLNYRLDNPKQGGGHGARSRLSQAIGVQTAYTAQVLRGNAHFSGEQAEAINEFLGHSEEEGHYFLLLVLMARAGTRVLKMRYLKQMDVILQGRQNLKTRLGVKQSLSEMDQLTYYSSWHFAAIHALISIPELQSVKALSDHLRIDKQVVANAIELLLNSGLIVRGISGERPYGVGEARIHLGAESPLISKHHTNWRMQSVRALENPVPQNLHYSSAVSLSRADATILREQLARTIEQLKGVVKKSPEEVAYAFSLDWFEI